MICAVQAHADLGLLEIEQVVGNEFENSLLRRIMPKFGLDKADGASRLSPIPRRTELVGQMLQKIMMKTSTARARTFLHAGEASDTLSPF